LKDRFHRGFDEFYVGRSIYQLTVQNRALIQSHRDETHRRFLIEGFVLRTVHKRVRRDYTLAADPLPFEITAVTVGAADARIEDVLATSAIAAKLDHKLTASTSVPIGFGHRIDVGKRSFRHSGNS